MIGCYHGDLSSTTMSTDVGSRAGLVCSSDPLDAIFDGAPPTTAAPTRAAPTGGGGGSSGGGGGSSGGDDSCSASGVVTVVDVADIPLEDANCESGAGCDSGACIRSWVSGIAYAYPADFEGHVNSVEFCSAGESATQHVIFSNGVPDHGVTGWSDARLVNDLSLIHI